MSTIMCELEVDDERDWAERRYGMRDRLEALRTCIAAAKGDRNAFDMIQEIVVTMDAEIAKPIGGDVPPPPVLNAPDDP
jgi:hypothetical protein